MKSNNKFPLFYKILVLKNIRIEDFILCIKKLSANRSLPKMLTVFHKLFNILNFFQIWVILLFNLNCNYSIIHIIFRNILFKSIN